MEQVLIVPLKKKIKKKKEACLKAGELTDAYRVTVPLCHQTEVQHLLRMIRVVINTFEAPGGISTRLPGQMAAGQHGFSLFHRPHDQRKEVKEREANRETTTDWLKAALNIASPTCPRCTWRLRYKYLLPVIWKQLVIWLANIK